MRLGLLTAALLATAAPATTLAAAPGDPLRAARRTGEIVLDGRLEEPAWDVAPAHDGFFQSFPKEGQPPSERTEVRVLYDDRALYVGIVCHDSRPAEIARPLGRRDNAPYGDAVVVLLDSNHDKRTAYWFKLNAAGVQEDALLFGEDESNADWDAVWDGATATLPDGWSAEFHIPLSVLRFSGARDQVWGFAVKRILARSREEVMSIPLKRGERGMVARLADLTGLTGLEPVQELSLTPYLAARASWRPRTDQEARPRIFDPSGDLGLDLRASLGRGLALQATVNPDFGQVEADQIMQNLSTFELFFPEKRPFFTQGMDLFQGLSPNDHRSPQQLFYSRRIGLDAPILGAAKLAGRVSDTLEVGLLEAVVMGAAAPADLVDFRAPGAWAGAVSAAFDVTSTEFSCSSEGRRVLFVHGDGLNDRDRKYRFWRWLSKSAPVRATMRGLPSAVARRLVAKTERGLADTNFRHKSRIPEEAVRRYARRRIAEGYDLVVLGHFHEARTWRVDGGEVRLLEAWFRSRRIEWL